MLGFQHCIHCKDLFFVFLFQILISNSRKIHLKVGITHLILVTTCYIHIYINHILFLFSKGIRGIHGIGIHIKTLANAAHVNKSYSCRLQLHLSDFTGKLSFRFLSRDPLNLESQNQPKNIPVGLPSSLIKIRGKSVQGFLSLDYFLFFQSEEIM